ncbi:MAG: hypothetical protein IKQ29_03170 [Bacilli bacterium]|nr:hypothetical protein [Bacilli bacterium]
MNEKVKIYFILSYTGTILSRLVRIFTKDEFCHVSLSLDKNLTKMYSFGRINPYIPFLGGFVHESPKWGTFKRFKNTQARIISCEVTKEQYNKIEQTIKKFSVEKKNYSFNIIGLIGVKLHKKIQRANHFYCAEFIKYLVEQADLDYELPEIIRPQDFASIPSEIIYQGLLKQYN